jgi:hypothetical protein
MLIPRYVAQIANLSDESAMAHKGPAKKANRAKKRGAARGARARARGVREERAPYASEEESPLEATMNAAGRAGFLDDRNTRIAARVSSVLVEQAKRRTGIASDTDLITYALALLALEDDFAEVFEASRGTIDPTLKLGC